MILPRIMQNSKEPSQQTPKKIRISHRKKNNNEVQIHTKATQTPSKTKVRINRKRHKRRAIVTPTRLASSYGIIIGSSVGAAALGLSPIPLTDWPVLVGIQAVMVTLLASVWEVPVRKASFDVVKALMGSVAAIGVTYFGKSLATVLKFVPGIGTVPGVAIGKKLRTY